MSNQEDRYKHPIIVDPYNTVYDETEIPFRQRPSITFHGATVVDNDAENTTDVTVSSIGGLVTSVGAIAPLSSSGGTAPVISLTGVVPIANGGTAATTYGQARTNLHLVPGTDVQAYSPNLDHSTLAGGVLLQAADAAAQRSALSLTPGVDIPTGTGSANGTNTGDQTITLTGDVTGSGTGTFATTLATVPVAKGGTGATTAAGARTNLGLVIGTDVQAHTAALDAVTGVNTGDQTITLTGPVTGSGTGTFATTINNIPNDTAMSGDLLATAIGQPATPSAGKARLYADSTFKTLAAIDDSGRVTHTVQTLTPAAGLFVTGLNDNGTLSTGLVTGNSVANIAALKALSVSSIGTGQTVWVATKKGSYAYDPTAATVAGDDNFYVAPTTGAGMYTRVLSPVPEWQTKATNGTGLYIDPTSGNDENAGDIGTPIKSMREFCARMWGAVFSTSPRLTAITGSAVAADANVYGFSCAQSAPFLFVGTPTVVAGSVVLSAATPLAGATQVSSITSTVTDFLTLGYVSNATRTLWARRANTSGGQTTFAALQKAHNSGGNFSVDVSPPVQVAPATLAGTATSQAFAAGNTIDLVSLPAWPGMSVVDAFLPVTMSQFDFPAAAVIKANFTGSVLGSRASMGGLVNANVVINGFQLNAIWSISGTANAALRFVGLGAQGLAAANINATTGGVVLLSADFTVVNGTLTTSQFGTIVCSGSSGWFQDSALCITMNLGRGAQVVIGSVTSIGIGTGNTNAATLAEGSRLIGSNRMIRVNAFGGGTPWSIGGTTYTDAQLVTSGVFDMNTMCSVSQ